METHRSPTKEYRRGVQDRSLCAHVIPQAKTHRSPTKEYRRGVQERSLCAHVNPQVKTHKSPTKEYRRGVQERVFVRTCEPSSENPQVSNQRTSKRRTGQVFFFGPLISWVIGSVDSLLDRSVRTENWLLSPTYAVTKPPQHPPAFPYLTETKCQGVQLIWRDFLSEI